MDKESLRKLLLSVQKGEVSIDSVLDSLKRLPFEDLGFAKVDHHRCLRTGFPEVIFCQGKTPEQIVSIIARLSGTAGNILATRAGADVFCAVAGVFPAAQYHETARCITVGGSSKPRFPSPVLVISAGTADLPVAEEACVTAETMGLTVNRLYDVGVAGLHRLLHHQDLLARAAVIIVVAGMEGALASVVAGLVSAPVIAVPTSVGYGASFGGVAALLGMLNSCAPGMAVVNIDNGYGAAAMAFSIIMLMEGEKITSQQ